MDTRVTVPAQELDEFVDRMRLAGVHVEDTGERITTEAGIGAESVVIVSLPTAPAPEGLVMLAAT